MFQFDKYRSSLTQTHSGNASSAHPKSHHESATSSKHRAFRPPEAELFPAIMDHDASGHFTPSGCVFIVLHGEPGVSGGGSEIR